MTNISDDRARELREWLVKLDGYLRRGEYAFSRDDTETQESQGRGMMGQALAILDDYSSLRAENERLQRLHETDEGVNLRLCEMHTNQ